MRGEHFYQHYTIYDNPGSSPHARGALKAVSNFFTNAGIIPACAGSTRVMYSLGNGVRDHPRMRGEHALAV